MGIGLLWNLNIFFLLLLFHFFFIILLVFNLSLLRWIDSTGLSWTTPIDYAKGDVERIPENFIYTARTLTTANENILFLAWPTFTLCSAKLHRFGPQICNFTILEKIWVGYSFLIKSQNLILSILSWSCKLRLLTSMFILRFFNFSIWLARRSYL